MNDLYSIRVQPVILAAGKGTRMGSIDVPKVLVPIAGRSMLSYLLDTFQTSGWLPPALIVGYQQEKVRNLAGESCKYIVQTEQLGTGHAVRVAEPDLRGTADIFVVVYGDQPLWSLGTITEAVHEHVRKNAAMTLGTVMSDRDSFYQFGRIIRDEQREVVAIRELKDCSDTEKAIQEYSPSLYVFSDTWLWDALRKIQTNNAQSEYYLTDLLAIAVAEDRIVGSVMVKDVDEALGINTSEHRDDVENVILSHKVSSKVH